MQDAQTRRLGQEPEVARDGGENRLQLVFVEESCGSTAGDNRAHCSYEHRRILSQRQTQKVIIPGESRVVALVTNPAGSPLSRGRRSSGQWIVALVRKRSSEPDFRR